jgi:ABC-type nickel/cobalt efflux system permease component RcnA
MFGAIVALVEVSPATLAAVLAAVLAAWLLWRQLRHTHARRHYYRQRDKQRREYWGWE